MTDIIGSLFVLIGAIFLFSAGLGLLRMPDPFTRIQTGTKATTLGNIFVLIGIAIYHPGWAFKLILLVYFVLVTNPISSHALTRAAHRIGTGLKDPLTVDALAEAERDRSKDAAG